MVLDRTQRGKDVFSPPSLRCGPRIGRGKPLDSIAPFVPVLNERIKAIALARGATLVDVYAALAADMGANISTDNLHPTDKGLQVIAETFIHRHPHKTRQHTVTTSSLFRRRCA